MDDQAQANPVYIERVGVYAQALRERLADPTFDVWRGEEPPTAEERLSHQAAFIGRLYQEQWNRYGWPEEVGGLGGSILHRAAMFDEISAADIALPGQCMVLETLASPMIQFAAPLAATMLPAALAGEQWWGQGFSEPEAGSDLAALRCRARREGDEYVVSGQKLWTSFGSTASHYVCLVRTGTPESRHRGLTMLAIDRGSPGVTVRPVAIASGLNELAEVYFEEVRVPAGCLIGGENEGWRVAMYLLQFERSMYGWQSAGIALRRYRDLRDQMRSLDRLPDGSRARFGALFADITTLRARNAQTLCHLAAGKAVGPEASVDKILLARVEIALNDLARDVLGNQFVWGADPRIRAWHEDWWYSRSATILGGSAEVQRTIIADHVLGLPKESV
ncbi:MAG: acyl-CoA dehydrogenase family protein [Aeromicrobium sp.]